MSGAPPELDLGLVALAALLVVALGGLQWWGRRHGHLGQGPIRMLGSQSLGGKRMLALVEVDGERLLVGVTDERVTRLSHRRAAAGRPEVRRIRAAGGGG